MCNKQIGKLTAFALCLLLCLASVTTAFADGTTYTIKEIDDMQITVGSEMMAVTRTTDSSDGYFSLPNNSYDDVMKKMKDGGVYMLATDSQQSITLSVSMFENDDTRKIDNYNRLSESELSDIVVGYQQNADGTTYSGSTVDEGEQDIVWIDFEFRATVGSAVNKQYQANTVVNGKNVSITIQRNGGDVIASDYEALKSVVSSVKFGNAGLPKNFILYVIIGAAVLVIIILIIIIILAKRAGRRRKKSRNDKIIKELAGKYNTGRSTHSDAGDKDIRIADEPQDDSDDFYAGVDDPEDDAETIGKTRSFDLQSARRTEPRGYSDKYDDYDDDDSRPVKSYTDAEIARLLGDTEDDENFIEALPATEADFEDDSEGGESVDDSLLISDYFDDGDEPQETDGEPDENDYPDEDAEADEAEEDEEALIERDLAEVEAEKPLKSVKEVFNFSKFLQNAREKAAEEMAGSAGEPEEEPLAGQQPEADEPAGEEPVTEEAPDVEEPTSIEAEAEDEAEAEAAQALENEQAELDDYNNDEVLVREEAKHNKFAESSDFFEEAPKKIMGVISRGEIEDAEEFDVIDEVEQKVTEVEKEPERREPAKAGFLQRVAGAFKSFGKHCGYFITNVSREIKRSRAKKKRQKAEEERRQRERQRRERQKPQPRSDGLVQVRSRGTRPQNRSRGKK